MSSLPLTLLAIQF